MSRKNKMKGALPLVLSFLTACILGCVPAFPLHSGQTLDADQITKIQRGKSTKDDILSSLGAPIAIAARDEVVTIQSPTVYAKGKRKAFQSEFKMVRGKYYKIDSDTFFELFSGNHALMEYHRIYYYYSAWSKLYGVGISSVWIYLVGRTDIDELWVLINEQTDVVEDYFFKLAS